MTGHEKSPDTEVDERAASAELDTSAGVDTDQPAVPQMTIDEFAAATRVPSRTIRYYQAKALLPPPTLQGRVAYYGPPHHARLALIAQLQDRGLKIDAIRELVRRIDRGELDVAQWLFKVGAAEDIRTTNDQGDTPKSSARS